MITLLSFVFVLGVLIFVHELGHFLMARRIGVRVLTFSLGFGPKLFGFRRGDTEYCISAVPLGGYVKMAGENPDDVRTGASDEFLSKSKWQRFQVLVMGPVMNLALAVLVMAIVLYQGAPAPAFEQQAVIVGSATDHSTGKAAGIQPGDRILSIDGRPSEPGSSSTWRSCRRRTGRSRCGRSRRANARDQGVPRRWGDMRWAIWAVAGDDPQFTSLQRDAPGFEAGLPLATS